MITWVVCKPEPLVPEFQSIFERFAEFQQTQRNDLLVWIVPTDRFYVVAVYKILQEAFRAYESGEKPERFLYVVLDSGGGDIHAAYLLMKMLRHFYRSVTILAPRWAKSAATLLCVGADQLIMTPVSELGPLDPQVLRPGQVRMRGALDEYEAFRAISQNAIEALTTSLQMLADQTGIDIPELLAPVTRFVSRLYNPVSAQIKPADAGYMSRILEVSREYVKRFLLEKGLETKEVERISYQLAYGYPSHGFVIEIEEARRLGLNVRLPEKEEMEFCQKLLDYLEQDFEALGVATYRQDQLSGAIGEGI